MAVYVAFVLALIRLRLNSLLSKLDARGEPIMDKVRVGAQVGGENTLSGAIRLSCLTPVRMAIDSVYVPL